MTDPASQSNSTSNEEYVVVARRYRPQNFDELIGQNHATRALRNAIETNRVGHAYLFTGARGVGKTSAARIFAKALNCEAGPTATPCGKCDICESITSGNDVDVLEIDGASNRGIDEIRQLRSNVNVRPSRARSKVYIIDEVHMLTKEAFNALLKTLEEPPEHVKFVFCTTDPEKIPITVLSRCQRFDFAPVGKDAIVGRLTEIVEAEGATAETEALELLARRAAGSMRDSQSLLEQLLSFGGSDITVDGVHALLGTADNRTVADIAAALQERDAAAALTQLDVAVGQGVDVGQLAEQLMGYLRDVMAAVVGAPPELLRCAAPAEHEALKGLGDTWGLETLLASVQILDQALVRMRQSVDRRILVETALIRISHLESLQAIPNILASLQTGAPLPAKSANAPAPPAPATSAAPTMPKPATTADTKPASKKKPEDVTTASAEPVANPTAVAAVTAATTGVAVAAAPARTVQNVDLDAASARRVWDAVVDHLEGLDATTASSYSNVALEKNDLLVVEFDQTFQATRCKRPESKSKYESVLQQVAGRFVRIDFRAVEKAAAAPVQRTSQAALVREAMNHPMVQQALDLFDADVTSVIEPRPDTEPDPPK